MTRRYRPIDLVALAEEGGEDLTSALEALDRVYTDVDEANARLTRGLDLPCGRGCDGCCHESVFLTPLEFLGAWDHAQTHLADEVLDAIVERGLAAYAAHRERIDAFTDPAPEDQAARDVLARELKFTCPFLDDSGGCRVYPRRELFARLFGCSFNDVEGGIYGCDLVGAHLDGKSVTLLPARATARRLDGLPLTGMRQVYPWYLNWLYGGG